MMPGTTPDTSLSDTGPDSSRTTHRLSFSQRNDYIILACILGLMGAFFWAIRGTSGFGGSQGGLLAGLGWGILWYLFSNRDTNGNRRPLSTPWMLAAITFGIAYGGLTGYGVYTAWIGGNYYLNSPEDVRDIAPWTGYAMLFVCGLHWGGVTGAFMAWCGPDAKLRWFGWIFRIGSGILGAFAALYIVKAFPQWFLPFYSEGLYQVQENQTSIRALGSIQNIAPHIGLFLGFLAFEIARKDWKATGIMMIMALGFAIPFSIGGYWHSFHGSAVDIDWWKNWEMGIGLGGGLAFGLVFYLFNRPETDKPAFMFTARSYVLGAAFPLWFVSGMIVRSAYRGFVSIHDITLPGNYQIGVWFIYLIPATILFVWFIRNTFETEKQKTATAGASFILILFIAGMYQLPLLYLIPSAILLGLLLYRPPKKFSSDPIPKGVVFGVLGLIVLVGFIVSMPSPLQLHNKILLSLYITYILSSLLLFTWLLRSPDWSADRQSTTT